MAIRKIFGKEYRVNTILVFVVCLGVMIAAVVLASAVQEDFGNVEVSNVFYKNYNGIGIRAKLFRPLSATATQPAPGVVYIHGYQNNRETSDPFCIELARRGFVVLNIDAIGRGNSGVPNDLDDPDFDETFGGLSSFEYLRTLPFVDPEAVGIMGHSVGGEIAYQIALHNPDVKALVISGTAYTIDATYSAPKNMLMIFGKYDEYRKRMTDVSDFKSEWMSSPQTKSAIDDSNPQFGETYGDSQSGTARRVFMPTLTHIQESHNKATVAEALVWMRDALDLPEGMWIDPEMQIWQIKEWATLIAMVSCIASLFPLGLLLLQTNFFETLRGYVSGEYACSTKEYLRHSTINGILILLYIPLIMVIFGFHVYVVPIDSIFPMMIVNAIAFWFLVINVIGYFVFRRWFKRKASNEGITYSELGLSDASDTFALAKGKIGRIILLATILFAFAYLSEHILESIFIVDFRFIFPFMSDLTWYRALMFLTYFPFFLLGFLQLGIFLHGQIRRPKKGTWWQTFVYWSLSNLLALVTPLLIMLALQYIPLFAAGIVPFVGPASALVGFIINIIHIIIVLILVVPLSTWFYQLTGNIYTGALLNALLVTWMFVSSQVIAPIPV
jgi:dienelactone hydrolase